MYVGKGNPEQGGVETVEVGSGSKFSAMSSAVNDIRNVTAESFNKGSLQPLVQCVVVSHVGQQARLAPVTLKVSEEMRLKRLQRDALFKQDARQLVVPIPRQGDPAAFLSAFLDQLIPVS